MKLKCILQAVFILTFSAAETGWATQLTYGKYFGTIQMDGQPEAIAVSLDAFVAQVRDPTVYPALEVIVRANLGGFFSNEYVSYNFYDPGFNFEQGILSLNDPENDLTGSLKISNTDSATILEGPIVHRLTNTKGRLKVAMSLEEGTPAFDLKDSPAPLVTILNGEYSGTCGKDKALLQIETARGLGANAPGNAMKGYSLTGRLGFTNGPLCEGGTKNFCGLYPYSTGTYSPFANRLTMQGPLGTLDCKKRGDRLECKAFGYDKKGSCTLNRAPRRITPPEQFPSTVFLETSREDMTPLPAPLPPDNEELTSALNGDFYGFLHFENRDVYQLLELNVLASTSTENQHVPNQVIVNPTMFLRLGDSWDASPALTLVFPQRIFGLNQGFAFQSERNDYYAVIGDWKAGYVSGVMYSRSYGRVGTFELQKGKKPAIPAGVKFIPNPLGDYRGPYDGPRDLKNIWSLSVDVPNQGSGSGSGGIPLLGRYSGPGRMTMFDASVFDSNTGNIAFLISNGAGDRLITGQPTSSGELKLLWPVAPALGAPMVYYQHYSYAPATKKGDRN